ncbi:MAG: molybdopterin containing oxidoreductase [Pseudolabrys sp.]|nr:molybdopterin containing oxidoreductase [Pseudolabrys sp.]MSP32843.1 molybdopterin containing oxidoreductase [Pseudolabrys sp.]
MTRRIERSIEELYRDDPERADVVAFGRETGPNRRGFLGGAGLAAMGAAVGGVIPFAANMPGGLVPAALAQGAPATPPPAAAPPAKKGPVYLNYPGKNDKLVVIGERPLVAETPEHLLDDDTTPTEKFFVRNNGQIPEAAKEPDKWKIAIDGEVNKKLELTLGELKSKFKPQTRRIVLECGGNGRSFFSPPASGNQWTNGGAGCAEWTGVRLADVLKMAGVKPSGIYTAHYAADLHLSGDASMPTLSRGVRMAKAMEPDSMIVWAMNGQPLPNIHGGPVRLLVPGWPGSASQKWLTRITIRDREHDGVGMGGTSYRLTINPMVPGTKADPKNFKILESMPVRSIITSPGNGAKLPAGTREVKLRGASWAGDFTVRRVDISTDYGVTWQAAKLESPKNKYDWQRWSGSAKLPRDGYYEIWARAMDSRGQMQPHVAPNWNPSGYGGNPMHRVAVLVG